MGVDDLSAAGLKCSWIEGVACIIGWNAAGGRWCRDESARGRTTVSGGWGGWMEEAGTDRVCRVWCSGAEQVGGFRGLEPVE